MPHLVLHKGVAHMDPASAAFEAMLEGWAVQQRARCLKTATIRVRLDLVHRLRQSVSVAVAGDRGGAARIPESAT